MTRKKILSPSLSILITLLVLLVPLALRVPPATGAELLADKHTSARVDCAACHKRMPPDGSVSEDVCIKCHGDLVKVAERTQKLPHNPHDSHRGDLACDACHHLHKPSVDLCAPCHQFGFRVP